MKAKLHSQGKQGGMPKGKLLLGAAGLLLFIVGVRRSFRTEQGEIGEVLPPREETEPEARESAA
ncbi:MAG TPA: hypothetical protein VGR37_11900 [Longimicrobiaceae bacterium]|nr:hypothetical protein [Longimicrobiaceae bacterium]